MWVSGIGTQDCLPKQTSKGKNPFIPFQEAESFRMNSPSRPDSAISDMQLLVAFVVEYPPQVRRPSRSRIIARRPLRQSALASLDVHCDSRQGNHISFVTEPHLASILAVDFLSLRSTTAAKAL